MRIRSERNTRKDWIAVVAISLVVVVWLVGTWMTSDARNSHLSTAAKPLVEESGFTSAPQSLHQAWQVQTSGLQVPAPVISGPVVAAPKKEGVSGINPVTGEEAWSYSRDRDLCGLTQAWQSVVAVFRGPEGCGRVNALAADSGQYKYERQAVSSDDVTMVRSNDYVGTVSTDRLELWRSDLVRTIEYGKVESPQEPGYQPHSNCTLRSALTRKSMLAIVEICPDEKDAKNGTDGTGSAGNAMARLLNPVPEDSRKPQIKYSFNLGSTEAQLVAIGQRNAAVYVDGTEPRIDVIDEGGSVTSTKKVAKSPAIIEANKNAASQTYQPDIADGPHHMFWWDGSRLYAFNPEKLTVDYVVEGALGTGAVLGAGSVSGASGGTTGTSGTSGGNGTELLVPVSDGIAVVDAATGEVKSTIPVHRDGQPQHVALRIVGKTIVEQQGDKLVGYRA